MKHTLKRIIACLLCAVLLVPAVASVAAEPDAAQSFLPKTDDAIPTVVIPGIFQSDVRMYDENGVEMTAYTRPFFLDSTWDIVKKAVKKVGLPLLTTLLTQRDFGGRLARNFADAVGDIVFGKVGANPDGSLKYNIKPVQYKTCLANLPPEDQKFVLNAMPMNDYVQAAGPEKLYFLSYNSFAPIKDNAEDLYELIQIAKRETGSDKVNIVPVSQGASIANYLLEYHPEVVDDLHKIIYVVPALDGANVLGDLYVYGLNDDPNDLYGDMFTNVLKDAGTGALVNLALRLFPNAVLNDMLDQVMDAAIEQIKYSTSMWALIPSGYYEQAADKYLSGPDDAFIRSQTDAYYQAQRNSRDNILRAKNAGVQVFDVVNYNHILYPIAKTWDEVNADGIIHLDSTSMGAVSAPVDGTLPADYTQAGNSFGTCADPTHNHIDPHRMVDASTGLLPDHTFYFYNGDHEKTAQNDVVIKLVETLMLTDRIEDVYTDPAFPQFNTQRVSRNLIEDVDSMRGYQAQGDDQAALDDAIAAVDAVIANTVVDTEAFEQAKTDFYAIYDKLTGEDHSPKELSAFMKMIVRLDAFVDRHVGKQGYSDVFRIKS